MFFKTIVTASLATCFLFSCGNSDKKLDEKTYQDQKEDLQKKEESHPLDFLTVHGNDKKNLFSQTVVRGTIVNNASVAAYKDVRLKMLCYKDNTMVEEHEDVIKGLVKPNTSKPFKTKYRLPKGTDSISLSVMSAELATEQDKKEAK